MKKKIGGHRARLREKEHLFRYRAYFEGNLNDAKIVRSRDAQCNTKELPEAFYRDSHTNPYIFVGHAHTELSAPVFGY